MKHKNLEILAQHGLPVPPFTVVRKGEAADLSFSKAMRFAVRSSFSMEDDAEHSFAGQFDTYLNVDRNSVADAVEKVRNSVHNQTVREYFDAIGASAADGMCVIVQEMVEADQSGVIFTANPLGILNETVITVGNGLGDRVVEDKIETTSYYYNNDDDLYLYHRQEGAPLLPEGLLQSLIDLSRQIKEIFHYEADIEFAIADGLPHILQVRPITTLTLDDPIILDNSNIVESYPGVSLPLTQDFVKTVYYGIFQNCIRRVTGDEALVQRLNPVLQNMVDVADWRIYYRISNWYHVLRLLPFSSRIIPMWQQMLGVGNRTVSPSQDFKVKKRTKAKILGSLIKYLCCTPKMMDELNACFGKKYAEYREKLQSCKTPREYLDLFEYIYGDILVEWDITLINDMYAFIYTALSGKNNRERLADMRNLESMKPLLEMEALISLAGSQGVESPKYQKAEQAYLECYGDRCLAELKMETHTYRTHPEMLRKQVLKEQGTLLPRQSVPAKKTVNPFVKCAKVGIQNREISRMNRSRLFGISRDIFRGIGEILVENQQIECVEDVFYLYMNELDCSQDFKGLVAERKSHERVYREMAGFSRLVYAQRVFDHAVGGQGYSVNCKQVLSGIASSAGCVEAQVLVVENASYDIDTTGKILVTRTTDPGWVFLIRNAVGIIAEKGSLLSHTAIISRELHKPAIVNVKDCTKLLHTGDRVRLNAYDGTVTII